MYVTREFSRCYFLKRLLESGIRVLYASISVCVNMASKDDSSFVSAPGFCPDCGSILPLLGERGGVICYACKREWGPEVFGDMVMTHTIYFNSKYTYASAKDTNDGKDGAEGPIVERRCPQCQNDKMSYATLQLRSADEGQTVFYTCTKCKYKETENS